MTLNIRKLLFPLMLSVCVLSPFGNDIYIPSLPDIGVALSSHNTQLVLTTFLFGLAVAQLFYGPLSDRFGRKPVLMVGLAIFTLASVVVFTANSMTVLLWGRFFQAVGTCSTIVSALAIVRDVYSEEEVIKATGWVMAIIGVCPALAPIIGGALLAEWGWRASFAFLLFLGVFYLLLIGFCFKETQQKKNLEALQWRKVLGNYKTLLSHGLYRRYVTVSACAYAILFAYISMAPYILMQHFGFGLVGFSIVFSVTAFGILSTSFIAPRLSLRMGLPWVTMLGVLLFTVGSLLIFFLATFSTHSATSIIALNILCVFGMGIIRPTASAGAMSIFPKTISGSAAAMFGFMSFTGGALSTFTMNALPHTILMFGLLTSVIALLGLYSAVGVYRYRSQ